MAARSTFSALFSPLLAFLRIPLLILLGVWAFARGSLLLVPYALLRRFWGIEGAVARADDGVENARHFRDLLRVLEVGWRMVVAEVQLQGELLWLIRFLCEPALHVYGLAVLTHLALFPMDWCIEHLFDKDLVTFEFLLQMSACVFLSGGSVIAYRIRAVIVQLGLGLLAGESLQKTIFAWSRRCWNWCGKCFLGRWCGCCCSVFCLFCPCCTAGKRNKQVLVMEGDDADGGRGGQGAHGEGEHMWSG